jgi:hypothetical protein
VIYRWKKRYTVLNVANRVMAASPTIVASLFARIAAMS